MGWRRQNLSTVAPECQQVTSQTQRISNDRALDRALGGRPPAGREGPIQAGSPPAAAGAWGDPDSLEPPRGDVAEASSWTGVSRADLAAPNERGAVAVSTDQAAAAVIVFTGVHTTAALSVSHPVFVPSTSPSYSPVDGQLGAGCDL